MGRNGFSLIELLIVMVIAGTLMGIASLYFRDMSVKSGIERQTKEMYADLMAARAEALFRKKSRHVVIASASFSIYSSADESGSPLLGKNLTYPVNVDPANLEIDFDSKGVATFNGDNTIQDAAVCSQQVNKASIDSVAVSRTQIQQGRQNSSGCSYANIAAQ